MGENCADGVFRNRVDLSIVIVNYNGASFLGDCLDSIFDSKTSCRFEVIIIDNASKDQSKTLLEAYPKPLTLIFNSQNIGFGAANNQGVERASGATLFLLNNDTKVFPNTIETLWQFCLGTPLLGAVSPKLLNKDGSLQGQGSVLNQRQFKALAPKKVSFIAGAAWMMKKSVFVEIGGFDENFFFYNEDLDLCKTLQKKGLSLYYLPTSQLIHYGGLSTKTRKAGSIIEGYRGGLYIAYKHYPRWVYHVYRVLLLFDILPKLLYFRLFNHDYFEAYWQIIKLNFTQTILCKRGIPSSVKG